MKIENTLRKKDGEDKEKCKKITKNLRRDIKNIYNKYKDVDIDYDMFHLILLDYSNMERVMRITLNYKK
jgi:predicted secreted Zn-dependent protease